MPGFEVSEVGVAEVEEKIEGFFNDVFLKKMEHGVGDAKLIKCGACTGKR